MGCHPSLTVVTHMTHVTLISLRGSLIPVHYHWCQLACMVPHFSPSHNKSGGFGSNPRLVTVNIINLNLDTLELTPG